MIVPILIYSVLAHSNNGKYDEATIFGFQQKWMALRTQDIHFVLDMPIQHAQDPGDDALYRRIDPHQIGLIGHSLGGAACAQVARERDDIAGIVNLDADLDGEYLAYADGQYTLNKAVYPTPLLNIDTDAMERLYDAVEDQSTIAVKHVLATAPDADELHLPGTGHRSVTDVPILSPVLVRLIDTAVLRSAGGDTRTDAYATIQAMNRLVWSSLTPRSRGRVTSLRLRRRR